MKNISSKFKALLFGIPFMIAAQSGFAEASGITCNYTNDFRDTLTVVRQDRPVNVTKTESTFGFRWSAHENYTNAKWEFTVNLRNVESVRVRLRRVQYDDDMNIFVNGEQIFRGYRNGYSGFDANLDVARYFKAGLNTITVQLLNPIPDFSMIYAMFDYAEGSCTFSDLPRPIIPKLPDSERCVESLVCTEPLETRNFGGINIRRNCWNWKTTRTCYDFIEDKSTCTQPSAQPSGARCETSSKQCLDEAEYNVGGNKFKGCILYETKTKCTIPVNPADMSPTELAAYNKENNSRRLACKPVQTCVGPDCYITSQEKDSPDQDMPYVLALLEIGNQAGKYMDKNEIRIFNGVKSQCRSKRGFGALAACCKGGIPPKATNSSGQQITPSNDNVFNDTFSTVDQKYSDPQASANEEYKNGGGNPYTYDSMYAPNEARYMLQGTSSVAETEAGKEAFQNGGGSKLTAMGYGYSPSGTSTGDQQSFSEYSQTPKKGTTND